jgi:hypothetical protein
MRHMLTLVNQKFHGTLPVEMRHTFSTPRHEVQFTRELRALNDEKRDAFAARNGLHNCRMLDLSM